MIKANPITRQKPHLLKYSRFFFFALALLFFIHVSAFSAEEEGSFTKKDLRLGQRLFMGLVPFESGTFDCSSCHYIVIPEEINWNPSAHDLAMAWIGKEGTDIFNVMNNPVTARMIADHKGMRITRTEEQQLQAYFTHLASEGPGVQKPYPIRSFTFWIVGLLMALALIDLLFTKIVRYRIIHIVVLVLGIGVHGTFARQEAIMLGRTQGYAPDQPIKFSHKVHAGDNQIDCRYCHFTADFSISGGIPSNDVCMNCHTVIRNGTNSGSFEINKIHKAASTGEPAQWIRVHKLPDHSFFSHAQHAKVAGIECQKCHGPVEEMHIIKQFEDLSMGWCINCHRDTKVPFLENEYYESYTELHEQAQAGSIDSVTAARLGGLNCMKCHY